MYSKQGKFSLILVSDWLRLFESFHGENYTNAAICCIFCGITGKIHYLEMAYKRWFEGSVQVNTAQNLQYGGDTVRF